MDVERVIEQKQHQYKIKGRAFGKNLKRKKREKVGLAQVFEVPESWESTRKTGQNEHNEDDTESNRRETDDVMEQGEQLLAISEAKDENE